MPILIPHPPRLPRSWQVNVRLTADEMLALREAAAHARRSISDYIRLAALDRAAAPGSP